MAKLSSNEYRVRVDSATPGTFAEVAGQISVTLDRGETSFSTIDKSALVETTGRAMRNYSLSLEYRPDLPDAAGHTRLETIFASGAATVIQVVKTGTHRHHSARCTDRPATARLWRYGRNCCAAAWP